MKMLIELVEVTDYMGLKKVRIEPGGRAIIRIAGMNESGKTSLFSAIGTAIGGTKYAPEEPVRHGAKRAKIHIVLAGDDGKLTVDRKFSRSGATTLELRSKDGKLSSPQKILDALIGTRFLDPLKFARLSGKKQREVLIGCVDIGIDLDAHAVQRRTAYDSRTDANRDVKRLRAELDASPAPDEIPEPVDPGALMAELAGLQVDARAALEARHTVKEIDQKLAEFIHDTSNAEQRVASLRDDLANWEADVIECTARADDYTAANRDARDEAFAASQADFTDEIADAQEAIKSAYAANEERAALVAQGTRHALASAALMEAETEAEILTDTITDLDEQKAAALSAAAMPIDGLDIDEDQVLFDDVPLSQASGARQFQISLAIAAALSPDLGDIWIKEGVLLDANSMKATEQFAQENGLQVWVERVGEGEDDCIILAEGEIKADLREGSTASREGDE